jgi:hypothetical protein
MIRCPFCSSTFVRSVRLNWWQRIRARVTGRRPYVCWHCGWQDWLTPGHDDSASEEGGLPLGAGDASLVGKRAESFPEQSDPTRRRSGSAAVGSTILR